MDTSNYFILADDAMNKLEALQRQRESIDAEIMKLEQLVAATANMLPDAERDVLMRKLTLMQELFRLREVGLTDAIRSILKASAGEWMTVATVRDRLIKAGFDFSGYSTNPLASVSTVLRRMPPEEVERTTVDGGVAAYRWIKKTLAVRVGEANQNRGFSGLPRLADVIEETLTEVVKKKK